MKKFKEYADFDLAKINSEILEFWKNENVFKKSVEEKPFLNLLFSMRDPHLLMGCREFTMLWVEQ